MSHKFLVIKERSNPMSYDLVKSVKRITDIFKASIIMELLCAVFMFLSVRTNIIPDNIKSVGYIIAGVIYLINVALYTVFVIIPSLHIVSER